MSTTNPLNINSDGLQRFTASTGAFQNIELTTKGDLLTRTASSYVRLGVGADGESLISQDSETPGLDYAAITAGSSVTYLATVTASASSTVDFTAFDDTTYLYYLFTYTNVRPSSDGADFRIRFSIDGGGTFLSSNYQWSKLRLKASSGSDSVSEDSSSSKLTVVTDVGSAIGEGIAGKAIYIPSPAPSDNNPGTLMHDNNLIKSDGSFYRTIGGGMNETSSVVNGIRFYFSSGNIAVGNFYMYGIKKS